MIVKVCDDDAREPLWCPFCAVSPLRWGYTMRCRHPQPANLTAQLRGHSPPHDCPLRTQAEAIVLSQEIESC
jgi:hypothetical protein